jgi:glycosyltransferase involved in cell wall biosynthesis
MRIGIDAKSFFRGPVSTRVVLQNLLPELFILFPEHEWIIFLDKKDKQARFPFIAPHVKLIYCWADINLLSNVFLLAGKSRSLRVDAIVYQMFPSIIHDIPSVTFIHDVLFRDYPQFFTWKERLYFHPISWLARNRSARLIATTKYVTNDLLKYNYAASESKIDLVPLGVSSAYKPFEYHDRKKLEAVKEKYALPDRYLLFVGRLNVRKNIENLLKAIMLIRDPQIRLVIVGKADWKTPDLKELLDKPELKKRIIMAGAMDDNELAFTYSMAKIFCFPSFAEGFGLPPLEAMASGVPVVVSETTALPEVCGDAAIYVDPYSPESIALAINNLLDNPELCESQKAKGILKAKQYNWTNSARAFMNSINNAVTIQ